ncbi:MAG: hypothetical protein QM682_17705 [Paracoccus sp. (in: a-proteobacteria)]|uniref:hypothetical protein n=1 Tax=Paracoccus sp. TaxID=267 RepID=UPI0039E4F50B
MPAGNLNDLARFRATHAAHEYPEARRTIPGDEVGADFPGSGKAAPPAAGRLDMVEDTCDLTGIHLPKGELRGCRHIQETEFRMTNKRSKTITPI